MLRPPPDPHSFRRLLMPSDWGMGMSVCIVATGGAGELVAASDHMLSMANGAFTAESAALKGVPISAHWRALFAGDDITPIPSLMRRVDGALRRVEGSYWKRDISAGTIALVVGQAYQEERRQRAADHYLSIYGVTLMEFLANSSNLFSDTDSAVLRERIERHQLNCELLVYGYSGAGEYSTSHVMVVSDPGVVREYDQPGYWAIGSGAYAALSSLAMRKQSVLAPLAHTIYHVCEAKFFAESAIGVGRDTYVTIHNRARWTALDDSELDAIRKEWERVGKPQVPRKALPRIARWLATHEAWVQTQTESPNNATSSPKDQA
jgi:hypothetical protein